jgi:hypothetical protein
MDAISAQTVHNWEIQRCFDLSATFCSPLLLHSASSLAVAWRALYSTTTVRSEGEVYNDSFFSPAAVNLSQITSRQN